MEERIISDGGFQISDSKSRRPRESGIRHRQSREAMTIQSPRPRESFRRGPHYVAVFAAVFTWPLLLVGGSVTVYRVGMAVPDWPTTFGINMFLYDFVNAPWGVYLEHSHRLFGAAVGLTCVVLA